LKNDKCFNVTIEYIVAISFVSVSSFVVDFTPLGSRAFHSAILELHGI
jgi:hypothetical protein